MAVEDPTKRSKHTNQQGGVHEQLKQATTIAATTKQNLCQEMANNVAMATKVKPIACQNSTTMTEQCKTNGG